MDGDSVLCDSSFTPTDLDLRATRAALAAAEAAEAAEAVAVAMRADEAEALRAASSGSYHPAARGKYAGAAPLKL